MDFHVEGGGQHLVHELPLPELLVLNHVRVAVPVAEVHVEVLDLLGNLLLQPALLLLYLYYAPVRVPIALDVLQRLLEEEGEVLGLAAREGQALDVDVRVVLGELLEADHLQVVLVEGLDEALLVVGQLGEDVLVEADAGLLVVHRRQDEVEHALEGLVLGQRQVDVVRRAQQGQVLVVRAVGAVVLHPVRCHDGPVALLYLVLHLLVVLAALEGHVVVESPLPLCRVFLSFLVGLEGFQCVYLLDECFSAACEEETHALLVHLLLLPGVLLLDVRHYILFRPHFLLDLRGLDAALVYGGPHAVHLHFLAGLALLESLEHTLLVIMNEIRVRATC